MPQPPSTASALPTAQPVGNSPASAGMMTPQEPSGEIEAGRLDVYHARKILERSYLKLPEEDQRVVLRVLGTLTKQFGEHEDDSEEFSPAEMKRMLATLAGPGATGPQPTQGAAPPPQQQPNQQ